MAGEIDLSRDEDSVMSLAYGAHKGKAAYLYAGVNSSPADIAKGRNQHLRTLSVEQSRSRASAGVRVPEAKISELSRSALFDNPDADTYQRLLRVAGSVGAAATGLGREPQLAIFEAASSAAAAAGGAAPKARGVIELPKDAQDLDIVQTGEGEFQVAYCHEYELHVVSVGKQKSAPELIYTMPDDHGVKPSFRSIRYLAPGFLLAAANLPQRSGAVLLGLRMPGPGHEKARLAVTAKISGKLSVTALAVTNLSPPASSKAPLGETQFVIAAAGNDSSISLFTLKHEPALHLGLLVELYLLHTLKDVHGSDNITGVAFSQFVTPKTHLRPQFIKLASISLQKTVAVHNIPLKKHVDRTPRNPKGPPRPVRYVVAKASTNPLRHNALIALAIVGLIGAIICQGVMEMYGASRPILQVHKVLPSWYGTIRSFDPPPAAFLEDEFIAKLAGAKKTDVGETLVMWEAVPEMTAAPDGKHDGQPSKNKVNLDVHDPSIHGPGKKWDELAQEQKEAWKDRLSEAGAWTTGMGETVFKGILFGELAGAVGQAVAG